MTTTIRRTGRLHDVVSGLISGTLITIAVAGLLAGCSSTLNPQVHGNIQAQIKKQQPSFAECYSEALKQDEELEGTMTLAFVVDNKTGAITDVAIARSQLKDEQLEQCVVKRAEGITVKPMPSKPVRVNYPITFSKQSI